MAAAAAAAATYFSSHGTALQDPALKMCKNLESIRANPVSVPAGVDDRVSQLHAARFLGGAVATVKKL